MHRAWIINKRRGYKWLTVRWKSSKDSNLSKKSCTRDFLEQLLHKNVQIFGYGKKETKEWLVDTGKKGLENGDDVKSALRHKRYDIDIRDSFNKIHSVKGRTHSARKRSIKQRERSFFFSCVNNSRSLLKSRQNKRNEKESIEKNTLVIDEKRGRGMKSFLETGQ